MINTIWGDIHILKRLHSMMLEPIEKVYGKPPYDREMTMSLRDTFSRAFYQYGRDPCNPVDEYQRLYNHFEIKVDARQLFEDAKSEIEASLKKEEEKPADYWFLDIQYDNKGRVKSVKVEIDAVAEYLINRIDIITIYGLRDEQIFVYQNGIWTPKGRGLVKAEIEDLLKEHAKNTIVLEIFEKIKRMTATDREDFDNVPKDKICLENGVLDLSDIENIQFRPHNKKYYFKTQLPITYDQDAKCPTCLEFLEGTFLPEELLQVQEWMGFHLMRHYFEKKAVILYGPKDTGKSVFLNLMTAFLGQENISGLSLQKITAGRSFDLLALKDKLANICDDLKSKDLNYSGDFKQAVGDGQITGEMKFGDQVRFFNTAKMTFSCNKIPSVDEIDDSAYFDRWLIWRLDNVVPKESQDKKLLQKLTTKGELSGLLNWAIGGLQRLIRQNGFSNLKGTDEIRQIMLESADPLFKFFQECVEVELDATISKEDLYSAFVSYCSNHKPRLTPCSKNQLTSRMKTIIPEAIDSHTKSIRTWRNITLKEGQRVQSSKIYKEDFESNKNTQKLNDMIFSKSSPQYPQSPQEMKVEEEFVAHPDDEIIHQKCHYCDSLTSSGYDDRGRPICKDCNADPNIKPKIVDIYK